MVLPEMPQPGIVALLRLNIRVRLGMPTQYPDLDHEV